MRTLVIGDVHGCADELALLVADARPTRVILVGDLFTKGPDPAGVFHQIDQGGYEAVLGNHDERLLKALRGRRRGDTEARECIARLDAAEPGWRHWLGVRPLFLDLGGGWVVVHAGLHPRDGVPGTTRQMALTMRRFPEAKRGARFWWEQYEASPRVVFGHDARRGLVRVERDGRPWLVGLDTGCVYGGSLSGYVLETDELFQVPAKRAYRPI